MRRVFNGFTDEPSLLELIVGNLTNGQQEALHNYVAHAQALGKKARLPDEEATTLVEQLQAVLSFYEKRLRAEKRRENRKKKSA